MRSVTYEEWFASLWQAYADHVNEHGVENSQLVCHFVPNYLSEVRPDIHGRLVGTDLDCYHNGDFSTYLTHVHRLWNERREFGIDVHVSLIEKLATQVEYSQGPRYDTEHDWLAEVSGCDTHGQERLSDDEEDLLRQIKGYPR